MHTTSHLIRHWARERPDAVAVIDDQPIAYGSFACQIAGAAHLLKSRGVGPGTIVLLECSARAIHLAFILAAECLGAVTVSVYDTELTPASDLLPHVDLLCVQTITPHVTTLPRVIPITASLIEGIRGFAGDIEVLAADWVADTPIRIGKTSGSTGRPKFSVNSRALIQRQIAFETRESGAAFNAVCLYQFAIRDTYRVAAAALQRGSTVLFATSDSLLDDLTRLHRPRLRLRADHAGFFANQAAEAGRTALPMLLYIGGGSLSASVRDRIARHLATDIRHTYSSNETHCVALIGPDGTGDVVPDVDVRIIDDRGNPEPFGEPGIIQLRSPRMVAGYLWNDALTDARFADGWLRTSDRGVMPAPRRLILLGRDDDLLNIGGTKLAPAPIEAELRALPGVRDAVLLSLDRGEHLGDLHAVIEHDPASSPAALHEPVTMLLLRHVHGFQGVYLDRLPRTDSGKVNRPQLISLLARHRAHPQSKI